MRDPFLRVNTNGEGAPPLRAHAARADVRPSLQERPANFPSNDANEPRAFMTELRKAIAASAPFVG